MLQWIKKHIPTREKLKDEESLAWLGKGIYSRNVWCFSRECISRGFAIGVFVAVLPIPLQSLLAICCALLCKGNLPIAFAATWISNPITFVPICLLILNVGLFIVDGHDRGIPQQDLNLSINWNDLSGTFSQYSQSFGKPFLVGLPIVAISAGLLAYILVHISWKILKRMR
jgi:uncharacterized protein (DUF2062 family)